MTDIVERLKLELASAAGVSGHAAEEAAAEITRLRLQLSLQKEKLPDRCYASLRPLIITPTHIWDGDWRDHPEAP